SRYHGLHEIDFDEERIAGRLPWPLTYARRLVVDQMFDCHPPEGWADGCRFGGVLGIITNAVFEIAAVGEHRSGKITIRIIESGDEAVAQVPCSSADFENPV